MIKIEDHEILKNNISTLKDTSLDDDNDIYMTECEYQAIDFDGVKDNYVDGRHIKPNPSSNDALLIIEGKAFFIEFKNRDMKKEIFKVKKKIYESVPILNDIIDAQISSTRKELEYILVYSEAKNSTNEEEKNQHKKSLNAIQKSISAKAKVEFIRFDLERFKNFFFKDVHTYTEKEFDDFLIRNNIR